MPSFGLECDCFRRWRARMEAAAHACPMRPPAFTQGGSISFLGHSAWRCTASDSQYRGAVLPRAVQLLLRIPSSTRRLWAPTSQIATCSAVGLLRSRIQNKCVDREGASRHQSRAPSSCRFALRQGRWPPAASGARWRWPVAKRPSKDYSQNGCLVLIETSFDSRAETITPVSAAPRARRQIALPSCRRRRAASGRGLRATAPR